MKPNSSKLNLPLLALAAFAFLWLIARACLQSVSIDEADAYLAFAAPSWPAHWYPSSGNHVLNTALVRLSTSLFPLSNLTIRLPALLGAALYIAAVYWFCTAIATRKIVQLPLFVCLVFNPFIADYLVASRGYSLALALLLCAIAILARELLTATAGPSYRACAAASVGAGLSFTTSFPFAFVDAGAILVFLAWAVWRARRDPLHASRIAAALLIPGIAVVFAICGSTLWNWPRGQLYYGAASLSQSWHTLLADCFYTLNPQIVSPVLFPLLSYCGLALPYAFCALLIARLAAKKRAPLENYLLCVLAFTFLCHWLAFHWFGLLLPMDRTAIFFVPLAVLLFAIGAAVETSSKFRRALGVLSIAALYLAAAYFLGCMCLSYFKEWKFDADVQAAYRVLDKISREQNIHDIPAEWRYVSALNFYRLRYANEFIQPFAAEKPLPPGKRVYVLYRPDARDFIAKQDLKIIYQGPRSNLVIAVKPSPG